MQQKYDKKELLVKAMNYCAYQERSPSEVMGKLHRWGAKDCEIKDILKKLIDENFLNESRYVELFVQGKFNIKHWGKHKIKFMLTQKGIDPKNIDKYLDKINEHEYRTRAIKLAEKKNQTIKEISYYDRKAKIYRYLVSKGFEPSLSLEIIDKTIKQKNE